MLFLLAVVCAARRKRAHHASYAKMLEMLNNGDTENYEAELAKLKSRNSASTKAKPTQKERFERAALAELKTIGFYMQLLTDKFVPKADQERALKRRLDNVKARLAKEKPSK